MDDARLGSGRYLREYIEQTHGAEPGFDGPPEKIIDYMVDTGAWAVGTPDDCIEIIHRLNEQSGRIGGILVQTTDWAPRDKMLRSYDLLARYVMPQFQGSVLSTAASSQ